MPMAWRHLANNFPAEVIERGKRSPFHADSTLVLERTS